VRALTWRLVAAAVIVASAGASGAQEGGDPETDLVRVLYAAEYGVYGNDLEGSSLQIYRIPIAIKLRDEEERGWGLRLTMPVSLAGSELRAATDVGEIVERIDTITVYPGMEARLPIGERWLLRPYTEIGVITAVGDAGSEEVFTFGAKWRVELGGHAVQWRLGGDTQLSVGSGRGGETNDFMVWELGGEASIPLGFEMWRNPADLAGYAIIRRFSGLEFDLPGDDTASIERQWELGLTIGTEPRHEVWGIRLPRFGVGYRFGDGLPGWRIVFGFPF
jgi:hypothetical protein